MKKISRLLAAFFTFLLTLPAYALTNGEMYLYPSNEKPLKELSGNVAICQRFAWSQFKFDPGVTSADINLTGPDGLNVNITIDSSAFGQYGEPGDEDYGVQFALPATYTTPGTYTFTFPKDKVYFGLPIGVNSFQLSYEVKGGTGTDPEPEVTGIPRNYTVTPDAGTYKAGELGGEMFRIGLVSFQTVDENFEGAAIEEGDYVTMSGPTGDKTYRVKSGVTEYTDPDTQITTTRPNTHMLEFEVPAADFAVAGTYTMKANLLSMKTYPVNMGREFSWQYIVEGNAPVEKPEIPYTVSPAAGEVTAFPAAIKVTLTDEEMVFPLAARNPIATITGPNNYSQKFDVVNNDFGNTITVNVTDAITTPGEYTVTIPTDYLANASGDAYEGKADIVINYTLKADTPVVKPELSYTVSPAAGEITAFPAAIKVTLTDEEMVFPLAARNPIATITGPNNYSQKFDVVNNDFGNTITVNVTEAITTPGEYTVTIPTDYLANASGDAYEGKADIVINYTLKADTPTEKPVLKFTTNPEAGEITAFPAEITVTLTEEESVYALDMNAKATMTGPDGFNESYYLNLNGTNVISFYVDFYKDITTPGEYTVTIPTAQLANKQFISYGKYADIVFNYTLKAETPVPTVNYTVTPDPKAGLYEMFPKEISVVFPDAKGLLSNSGVVGATMKIECAANSISEEVKTTDFIMPNGYKFAIDKEYTLPGTYKCSIDFSDFKIYNEDMSTTDLSVIEFEYVVGGVTTRVEPAPGIVDKVAEINITVTNAQKVELAEGAAITLKNAAGADIAIETSVKDNVLTVKVNPEITEAGEYTLTIPAGSLLIDGLAYDKAIYLDYSIKSDAIDAIFAGETSLDVYGIDGTIVVRKATRDDFRTLSKGIYVVGGKKVVVK